ncbi:MAG: DNA-binding protein WhiA [Syntrophomonadaceae bacterium]|jgi:DNA-binding protein WhiA
MKTGLSFTAVVKEDIARFDHQPEILSLPHKKALLSAFTRFNGEKVEENGQKILVLRSENAKVARYIYRLFQEIFAVKPTLSYEKNTRFNKRTAYFVRITAKVEKILAQLKINYNSGTIDRSIVYSDDTASGYASGAFLASGTVNSPESSNYHLEIACHELVQAEKLARLMEKFRHANFTPKVIPRRNKYVVYLKKSDQIGEFLIFIGATSASLRFEETRIDRDTRNAMNRIHLCDAHNYRKTVVTAQRQIASIRLLEKTVGLENLTNEKMTTLAYLRLQHEDANYQELALLLSEEMGLEPPVSKSNIAHLFREMDKLALRYGGHHAQSS